MAVHDRWRDDLLQLLDERVETAKERESTALDRRLGNRADRLLLFGAGNLGKRALASLRSWGREPLAFLDNNPRLWGTKVDGVDVFSPADAARRFPADDVALLVTIWCGQATDKMSDRIEPIRALGFRRLALFGHLAWKHPDALLPHYLLDLPSKALAQRHDIMRAFDLFEDQGSRELFLAHMRFRLHLDYDALPSPVGDLIYFNSRLIAPNEHETLVDGGGYDGDTVQSFLETFGRHGFRKVLSVEPSPVNFEKLRAYATGLPESQRAKVSTYAAALGAHSGVINVEAAGGPAARVDSGDLEVPCVTVDELCANEGDATFIKLDIEGYEPQALTGAREVMQRAQPVLAVCAYHSQDHLWALPLAIAARSPDHRLTLVPHLSDGWDLVLYAVPPSRVLS